MTNTPMEAFGQWLRSQREAKGVTLGEIASKTKIPLSNLEALETGTEYDLPAPVFVKGFLRSFAIEIGLPPEEVLDQYRLHVQEPEEEVGVPITVRTRSSHQFNWLIIIPATLGVLIIGIGLYYFVPALISSIFSDDPAETRTASNTTMEISSTSDLPAFPSGDSTEPVDERPTPETLAQPEPVRPVLQTDSVPLATPTTTEVVSSNPMSDSARGLGYALLGGDRSGQPTTRTGTPATASPPSTTPPVVFNRVTTTPTPPTTRQPAATQPTTRIQPVATTTTGPPPTTAPVTTATATTAPATDWVGDHELKLVFNNDTWVQVVIDGQGIQHGLFKTGATKSWTAKNSISIRIGNAGAVSAVFDGRDLGPLGPDGKAAKIELPKK